MTTTCLAGVFTGDGRYDVRELPVPDPPAGGALLRVEAVGLCGSDVAQLHGVEVVPGGCTFPVVPGHETVGRIVAVGDGAEAGLGDLSEGDRVAVDEVLSTEPMRLYGYSDMTGEGRLGLWGGYGEYLEVFPGTTLHRLPGEGPAAPLTLFEPLASAVNWVEIADVREGDSVVVQGPGHQGLAVVEAVLARAPSQVIVTGTSRDELRLETARAIGAHHTVMVDTDDVRAIVADLTGGRGADVVFDVATAVQTVPLSMELVAFRGRVLLAGLKHFAPIPDFATDLLVVKGLQVYGGAGFTPASMAKAVALIADGAVNADHVAGVVVTLDTLDEGMALLTRSDPSRDAVRVTLSHERT